MSVSDQIHYLSATLRNHLKVRGDLFAAKPQTVSEFLSLTRSFLRLHNQINSVRNLSKSFPGYADSSYLDFETDHHLSADIGSVDKIQEIPYRPATVVEF